MQFLDSAPIEYRAAALFVSAAGSEWPWRVAAPASAPLFVLAAAAWIAGLVINSNRDPNHPVNPGNGNKSNAVESGAKAAFPEPTPYFLVTSPLDDDSDGTLRWAVNEANIRPGPNVIGFDLMVFATPQTITLSMGELLLTDSARKTIIGPPAGLTISSKGQRRKVFAFNSEPGATMSSKKKSRRPDG